ncbi:MAG: Dihydrofolate reductase [Pseudonocardiales bacterium]|nr:Dihydrofolate reductase [Pseudonocardiales bacterium]
MGKVVAAASISLDGYIAKHDNTIGRLFDWYENGVVACPTATPDMTFHLTPQSAEYWNQWTAQLGAIVCGCYLTDGIRRRSS